MPMINSNFTHPPTIVSSTYWAAVDWKAHFQMVPHLAIRISSIPFLFIFHLENVKLQKQHREKKKCFIFYASTIFDANEICSSTYSALFKLILYYKIKKLPAN